MLLCAVFAGPAGPAFFFLPFLLPVRPISPSCVDGLAFSHPGLPLLLDSLTAGSHGSNRASLELRWSFSYSAPKTAHRAEFGILSKTGLPIPRRGMGWVSHFLGSPDLPCSFTTGPQWPNRAGLELWWCRFPIPPSNRPQIAAQGRVWFSSSFPGALLLRESRQLTFQVVIYHFVNGQDRIKQRSVSRSAVQSPHRCRQGFDKALVL